MQRAIVDPADVADADPNLASMLAAWGTSGLALAFDTSAAQDCGRFLLLHGVEPLVTGSWEADPPRAWRAFVVAMRSTLQAQLERIVWN